MAADSENRFSDWAEVVKHLTGLSQDDFDLMHHIAPLAREWADEIVAVFYNTLYANAQTAAVFHDGERPERERTLRAWYLALLQANDDDLFWSGQTRIAFAHLRRHVSTQYMVGIAVKMREVFERRAIEALGRRRGQAAARAFDRILSAVVGLTAEGYDVLAHAAFDKDAPIDENMIAWLIAQDRAR